MSVERIPSLAPIHKQVTVARTPADAFAVFTEGIGRWWPLRTYSIGQERARRCAIEGRLGGRLYEVDTDGQESVWGTVIAWDPPHRLAFTWHPGREEDTAQEVEVRFTAVGKGTRVELEHRGWARYGKGAEQAHEGYGGGWAHVFEQAFAQACEEER